jgi:hypothetical protein
MSFAVYRLSGLIVRDEGPLSIFLKMRVATGAYDYTQSGRQATNLGRGISCVHCVSIWVSIILVSLYFLGLFPQVFLYIAGISGVVSFLFTIGDKRD